MTSVEHRTRAAMDAITRQVDAAPPPPLPLPPPAAAARRWRGRAPRRRWGPWIAPAAAAAAMIAVAVTLVAVRNGPAGRPATPVPASPGNTVPEYYLAIPGYKTNCPVGLPCQLPSGAPDAVVGDTFTGKRLATVPAPAGWKFNSVAAAGDDLTFVVGAFTTGQSPERATHWFLIRLTPGRARRAPSATLREIPLRIPSSSSLTSMALSPDGTEIALYGYQGSADASVWVYSTATGALVHSWSLPHIPPGPDLNADFLSGLLSWTSDGHQLAFQVITPGAKPGQQRVSIQLLPAGDPGHDLLADSRAVWSMTIPASSNPDAKRPLSCAAGMGAGLVEAYPSIVVSGDGTTLLCGASGVFRDSGRLVDTPCPAPGVLEYSTATGKPAGTLYRGEPNCAPSNSPVLLLWASASGDAGLGYLQSSQSGSGYRFGLFKAGTFTPLPAPPTIATDLAGTAW